MTTDSTDALPARRPKSSLAQTVTAWATGILALCLIWIMIVLFEVGESLTAVSSDAPAAVSQWLCLPYTEFVLNQHRAGLTAEQIAATLEVSEYTRSGQPGVTAPVADIVEPRLDSMDACGLPYEIINASGLTPTP